MHVRDVQALLASANYYAGAIDGDAGPQTLRGVQIVERNGGFNWSDWSIERRLIAAGQVILAVQGFEPGVIDGYAGHNTLEALTAWETERATGVRPVIPRRPASAAGVAVTKAAAQWPRQRDMENFYGRAGGPEATAGICILPFAFPIAWNPVDTVRQFACHRRLEGPMTAIFAEAARHYGEAEYRRLRLDLYGGCFNNRNMRGGDQKSTHAYGAAVDLDPDRNQLRWGNDRAAFARSEYDAFWAIVEAQGALSLGRAADMDWMHFQFARL
jgi:hypothetical protein